MDGLAELLGRSPELFPHALDPGGNLVSLIHLTRADFEAASFLDQRIITPRTLSRLVAWSEVAAAIEAAKFPERPAYIFHIGHVGSTLLSRLLGAHPEIFALREPLALRAFAQVRSEPEALPRPWSEPDFQSRLGGILKLFSRTFDSGQQAVIKATSFVSELAAELLARESAPRALMMFVSPEIYLASILGGPNSRQEAKVFTPGRLKRLNRRVGRDAWRLESLQEGQALALAWACEMSALAAAARSAGDRVALLDFEAFLRDPATRLREAFRHFGVEIADADLEAILNSPHMHRYSKAPEHSYDAALRHAVLNEARALHAPEIARGLAWLERAAAEFPAIRDALELSRKAAS